MQIGAMMALASAFLAALFGVFNKKMVTKADTKVITFVELGSGWLFLCLLLPFYLYQSDASIIPQGWDWGYLIVLALVCTTFAFVLSLNALRFVSAFTIV